MFQSYAQEMKLGGVIYLHEISQNRVLGTTRKNVKVFRELCGKEMLPNVVLATTKWGRVAAERGAAVEKQQLRDYLWKNMIESGSTMCRFQDTCESAWEITDIILGQIENTYQRGFLQIQEELVGLERRIPETNAGKELRKTLQSLLEIQRRIELNGEDADSQARVEFEKRQAEIHKSLNKQVEDLKVSLPRRLLTFLHLSVSFSPIHYTLH